MDRAFENTILRRIYGSKRQEVADGENYMIKNFVICILH